MVQMYSTEPPAGITGTTNFSDIQQMYGGPVPSAGTGAGVTAAPTEPLVFLGTRTTGTAFAGDDDKITKSGYASYQAHNTQQKIATLSQAIQKFDKMSFTEQREMLRLLAIGGFAGAISLDDIDEAIMEASQQDARTAYMSLLETASDYYMSTGAMVTPDDVLRSAIAYRLEGMGVNWNGSFNAFDDGISKNMLQQMSEGGEGGVSGLSASVPKPGIYTTTQTSTDVLNPQDAKALTRAMLQSELGRDPTQAEYEDFLAAINAAERENPTTQTTTTKYVLDKNDSLRVADQSTVTEQGIGAEGLGQLAYEKAKRQPDWAEWQAMGIYAPALFQALGAAVPGA